MSRSMHVYEQVLREVGQRAYRGIKKDAWAAPAFLEDAEVLLGASPARLDERMGLLVVTAKRVLYVEGRRPRFAEFTQAIVGIRVLPDRDDATFCRLALSTPEQVQHVSVPIVSRDRILQAVQEAQPQAGGRARSAAEFVAKVRADEGAEQVRQLRWFAAAALAGNVVAYLLWSLEWPVVFGVLGLVAAVDQRAKTPEALRSSADGLLVAAGLVAAVNVFVVLGSRGVLF